MIRQRHALITATLSAALALASSVIIAVTRVLTSQRSLNAAHARDYSPLTTLKLLSRLAALRQSLRKAIRLLLLAA